MRSDYLGDCAQVPGLAEAVNLGEYLIPRLERAQMRVAIEGRGHLAQDLLEFEGGNLKQLEGLLKPLGHDQLLPQLHALP